MTALFCVSHLHIVFMVDLVTLDLKRFLGLLVRLLMGSGSRFTYKRIKYALLTGHFVRSSSLILGGTHFAQNSFNATRHGFLMVLEIITHYTLFMRNASGQ